ncbi:hypothetical protein F5883DRAFT_228964 [Diaporthe sp. PMI_573]|nr:hypothetical protein F5883DRAFT_228964 [Diaporthaceae sp. PMI_573]
MSTTSRDVQPIPRGETNQKSSPVNHEDSFRPQRLQKLLLSYDFQYPTVISTTTPRHQLRPTTSFTHTTRVRREQGRSLFTHSHNNIYIYPGLFTAKERTLPLTRKKIGRIFTNASPFLFQSLFQRFNAPVSPQPQLSRYFSCSPFSFSHISTVLLGRLGGGEGRQGVRRHFGPPFHHLFIYILRFIFISFLVFP